MSKTKKLYSSQFAEYALDDATLKKLQDELFKILLDVKFVCDKYDIKFMLFGGTFLGAVRHKGFIPWDDDIDLMMQRKEVARFVEKFREEFPDKYVVAEPLCDEKYIVKSIKIYKKGTTYIEIPYAGIDKFNMLFVDIFVIENVPSNAFLRKIHCRVYNFFYRAASVCVDYKYPSPPIMEKAKENEDVAEYMKLRRRLGSFFSHVGGMKFYLKLCDKIGNKKRSTGWVGIPSAGYTHENYPENILCDTIPCEFCGETFLIPAAYDRVLTNMFGDYMKIPAPEKRERHTAYKVDL